MYIHIQINYTHVSEDLVILQFDSNIGHVAILGSWEVAKGSPVWTSLGILKRTQEKHHG